MGTPLIKLHNVCLDVAVAHFAAAEETLLTIADMQATAHGAHVRHAPIRQGRDHGSASTGRRQREVWDKVEAESSVCDTGSGSAVTTSHWEPDAGAVPDAWPRGFLNMSSRTAGPLLDRCKLHDLVENWLPRALSGLNAPFFMASSTSSKTRAAGARTSRLYVSVLRALSCT